MGFQRARSEEQKRKRVTQITDAAEELLNAVPYREITLDMIAGKLSFSRANLSRYAATKEEIFLLVYVRQLEGLTQEAVGKIALRGRLSIEAFAGFSAGVILKYENFLRIGSILNTVIELNIEAERLAVYKKRIFACLEQLNQVMRSNFDFLDPEQSQQCLMDIYAYISGLYPMMNQTPAQQEAVRLAGVQFPQKPIREAFSSFLTVLLRGYRAVSRESGISTGSPGMWRN